MNRKLKIRLPLSQHTHTLLYLYVLVIWCLVVGILEQCGSGSEARWDFHEGMVSGGIIGDEVVASQSLFEDLAGH